MVIVSGERVASHASHLTADCFLPGITGITANPKECQYLAAFEYGNKVSGGVIESSFISGLAVFNTVRPINN